MNTQTVDNMRRGEVGDWADKFAESYFGAPYEAGESQVDNTNGDTIWLDGKIVGLVHWLTVPEKAVGKFEGQVITRKMYVDYPSMEVKAIITEDHENDCDFCLGQDQGFKYMHQARKNRERVAFMFGERAIVEIGIHDMFYKDVQALNLHRPECDKTEDDWCMCYEDNKFERMVPIPYSWHEVIEEREKEYRRW